MHGIQAGIFPGATWKEKNWNLIAFLRDVDLALPTLYLQAGSVQLPLFTEPKCNIREPGTAFILSWHPEGQNK